MRKLHLYFRTLLILCGICTNSDGSESYYKERYRRNYGCEEVDEYVIHNPVGPNCPCGYFAIDIAKKDIRTLSPGSRRPPYWKISEEGKGELQHYRCVRCSLCGDMLPVLEACSTYSDTECGWGCEPPYVLTSAGCYILQTNSTNGTTEQPSTSPLQEGSPTDSPDAGPDGAEDHPSKQICPDNDYSIPSFVIGVLTGSTLTLFVGILWVAVNRCRRQKRSRPPPRHI